MQPLISIIIPVYNVENYLKECLESVLSQDFDDYEIVAVDDGSNDNSYNILLEYAANEKVKVFSKQNGGLSDARNFGIGKANGKYIMFLDSDDYLSEHCLKKLACDLKNDDDVIVSAYERIYANRTEKCDYDTFEQIDKLDDKKEKLDYYIKNSKHFSPSWKSVVKMEFIKKYDLQFLFGRLHEDAFWSAELFDKVDYNKICFTKVKWYNHRQTNEGSITKNIGFKNVKDLFEGTKETFDKIKRNDIRFKMINSIYSILNVYYRVTKEQQNWVEMFIKENKNIFKSSILRHKIFYWCMSIFGVRFTFKLAKKFI